MASGISYRRFEQGTALVFPLGTAADPSILFGNDNAWGGLNDGIYGTTTPSVAISINGTKAIEFKAGAMEFPDGTAALPSITFASDPDTGLFSSSANVLGFAASGAVEMLLSGTNLTPGADDGSALGSATVSWADLFLATGGVINWANGDVTLTMAANLLTLDGGDLLIANGFGQVIGHTAQIAAGAVTSEFQMHGTAPADSTALLAAWSADAVPPRLYFAKSRSATIGTFGIITTGDNLGEILAFGDDGVDFNSNANASAAIIFDSAGTIAADRVPGQILLQTATDAAPSVLTTAVTISPAQNATFVGSVLSTSATKGIGYGTGAGGTVTQGTNKSTGVTLDTITGIITMVNSALAGDTTVAFTLTDSAIAATDAVIVLHESVGTIGAYSFGSTAAGGSAVISVHNNTAGSLSEAIVLRFVVIKSVNA